MRHQTPQFIEVEDKVVGPFTLKQFIYLAGGAGATAVFYVFLPFWAFLLLATPVVVLAVALAFYKVNNRPFVDVLESGFYFITKKRLYLWQYRNRTPEVKKEGLIAPTKPADYNPSLSLSSSRLKDISLDLLVSDNDQQLRQ